MAKIELKPGDIVTVKVPTDTGYPEFGPNKFVRLRVQPGDPLIVVSGNWMPSVWRENVEFMNCLYFPDGLTTGMYGKPLEEDPWDLAVTSSNIKKLEK